MDRDVVLRQVSIHKLAQLTVQQRFLPQRQAQAPDHTSQNLASRGFGVHDAAGGYGRYGTGDVDDAQFRIDFDLHEGSSVGGPRVLLQLHRVRHVRFGRLEFLAFIKGDNVGEGDTYRWIVVEDDGALREGHVRQECIAERKAVQDLGQVKDLVLERVTGRFDRRTDYAGRERAALDRGSVQFTVTVVEGYVFQGKSELVGGDL